MVNIEWAPSRIPPQRRIQTLAVGAYVFLIGFIGMSSYLWGALLLVYGNAVCKIGVLLYALWIYIDRDRIQNGVRGSGIRWLRDNVFWKHFRDYFPVELVKTADLPANKNYLLACYPHGVIGIGVFTNMAVDISKWNELFPKVRPQLATLALNFNIPLMRVFLQAWGMISVTKNSLLNNLTTSNDVNHPYNADGYTANAVAVVVGGAQEALDSKPETYVVTIKNRKGFVKLAIKSGAAIVPVISFGEVDVFDQVDNPPDSFLRKLQNAVKKCTGVSPLIVKGRGFFQYSVGFLPKRKRIVQVVGAPIEVERSDKPGEQEVNRIHEKFMKDLNDLFETHKQKYITNWQQISLIMR